MPDILVGSESVEIVPDARRFAKLLAKDVAPASTTLGKQIGTQLSETIARGIRDGLGDGFKAAPAQSQRRGRESGSSFAGAFDKEVRTKVRAALQSLPNVDIDADSSQAQKEIAQVRASLERLSNQRIGVDIDEATALNRLETLQRKLAEISANDNASIGVKADTTQAALELDKIKVSAERVGAMRPTVTVDADTAAAQAQIAAVGSTSVSSSAGVSGLVATGLLLGPALVPAAAAATAGLVGLSAAAFAAAGGIGVAVLAFAGIGDAVKSVAAAENSSAADAETASARRVASARQIESAQDSLASAQVAQSEQAERGAQSVALAQRGIVDALQGVKDAQRSVSDARRSAADGVQAALDRVRSAEEAETQAVRDAKTAQDQLNGARADAKRALQDLQMQLRDGELSERQAALSLERARARMSEPMKSGLDREQAQLDYDQAKANLDEIRVRNQRLATEKKKSDKAGVDGSAQVVSAQQRLIDAQQRQKDSSAAVAGAEQDVTRAREDGARRVAAAQRGVTGAQQKVVDAQQRLVDAQAQQQRSAQRSAQAVVKAQRDVARAHTDAAAAADKSSAAQTKAQQAMAGLSPEGRKFATFILGLRGGLSSLQRDAAKGFLPGLETGMRAAGKALAPHKGLIGDFAKEMGDLATSAGKGLGGKEFQSFFTMLGKSGPATLGTTGRIIGNIAKAFAGLAVAFEPISTQVLGGLESLTSRFADFANEGKGGGLQRFVNYMQEQGPKVAAMLGSVARAAGHVLVAIAPFGQWVVGAIKKLADGIAGMPVGTLRKLIGVVIGLTLAWKAATVAARAVEAAQGVQKATLVVVNGLKKISTLWTNRETAATVRSTIATKAKTFATKAAAGAQRLLNLAMRMNPLGMVITALVALGAGLVLAYKKSATFRRIVDAAWAGVKKAAKAVVDWWTGTAWPAIKRFFTGIGNSMVSAKNRVVGAWNSIKNKIVAVKDWITKTAWPALKSTLYKLSGFIPVVAIYRNWDKITAKFRAVWGWVKNTFGKWWSGTKRILTDPVGSARTAISRLLGATGLRKPLVAVWTWVRDTFKRSWAGIKKIFTDPIESARTVIRRVLGKLGLQKTFRSAADAIGRIWAKVEGKLKSPITKGLTWMNKHLIGKLNTMLGKIPGVKLTIPLIPGFADGGKLPGRAGGGVINGPWRGPRADNVLGLSSRGVPTARVNPGEYITQVSSTRSMERKNPGALDYINRFGDLPRHAIGGKVGGLNKKFLGMLSAFNEAAGGRYSVNSGYRSNAHQQVLYNRYLAGNGPVAARPGSSQHNKGLAADLAPSNARDVHAALARQFGLIFTVPSESWHIEPSWGRGSNAGPSSGGGGFGLPAWVSNPLKWAKDKIGGLTKGFLGDKDKYGLAGHVLPAAFTSIKNAVGKQVKSAASVFGIGGGGGGGTFDFGKVKGATNMALGQGMAAKMGWTGGQWTALKELWRRESGWNHLAKNPSSGAYGIPQALPASKMASVMQGGGSDYLTNPRTQMSWGLRYISGRYRNPAAALAFHDRMNWYADGGKVTGYAGGTPRATPGPHWVGEHGPELLWFRGGERVASAPRSQQLVKGQDFDRPIVVNVHDRNGQLMRFVDGRIDAHDDFATSVGRMGRG